MKEVLDSLPQLAKVIGEENVFFPYSHNNGVCEKLSKNNHCLVYENRPIICNVEKLSRIIAEKTGQDFNLIKSNMYEQHKRICLKLQTDIFNFSDHDID
jgi:hypothetical protein